MSDEYKPISCDLHSQYELWIIRAQELKLAWQDEAIRPAIVQTFSVGVFFAGAYMVLLPLMVRDLYDGGSAAIAGAFAANMLGTVVVVFTLMRIGRIAQARIELLPLPQSAENCFSAPRPSDRIPN